MKTMENKVLSKSVSEAFKPFFSKLKKSDDEPPFNYSFKNFVRSIFKIADLAKRKKSKHKLK